MSDHRDIEKLPLEIEGIPVRETIREIFRKPENGVPDNISKAGCLEMVIKSNQKGASGKGYVVWNAWQDCFLNKKGTKKTISFSQQDFRRKGIHFVKFQFYGDVHFVETHFDNFALFRGAKFDGRVIFEKANLGKIADFHEVRFGRGAFFQEVIFEGKVDFLEARFFQDCVFSNCTFKRGAAFSNAIFYIPPVFHGCELHQDTDFEDTVFPLAQGNASAARAYRTLKLAFSKQQAIREEQRFFKLEMEEETLRETGLKRWLFKAYKTFSDYGFSITRPLVYGGFSVFVLSAIFGFLSWLGQCGFAESNCQFAPQWLEFSLLQIFPFPSLDNLSEEASKTFWPFGAWWSIVLSAFVIVHKVISFTVLFLIGLALRNLFKLK